MIALGRMRSEPHAETALHLPHRVRLARQTKLRASENRVHCRECDVIDHVGGIEPPIEREAIAPEERAAEAGVEHELRGAPYRVAPGVSPLPRSGSRKGVGAGK